MIGQWIKRAATLVVCVCLGTLIAEAVMLAHVWSKWEMNLGKVRQMLAIAQGYDLVALGEQVAIENEAVTSQQPSLAEIADARAMQSRNLDLREQALGRAVEQLRFDQNTYAEQLARFEASQKAFETRLASMTDSEIQSGVEQNIVILQNMKAKQAKKQLMRMVDKQEMDDVVRLMSGMSPSKRKKISAEFRTEQENDILGEILRRIREGFPMAAATADARRQLQQPSTVQR